MTTATDALLARRARLTATRLAADDDTAVRHAAKALRTRGITAGDVARALEAYATRPSATAEEGPHPC